jgi:ribosome recycling factor
MILLMDFADTRQKMEKSLQRLREEIATIRTGRASPALIENIVCQVYQGTQSLKLNQLASITASDPQILVVQPWDSSIVGEIKNGILAANVGLTPVIEGNAIRISVPPLTTERRQEYVKLLRQKAEEARVAIRNVRRDKMVEIKEEFENKRLTEDEKFRTEEELQKITDSYIEMVGELEKKKEAELLQV